MRRLAALAGLALLLASCNAQRDEQLIAYGVGTSLYSPETAKATAELETYFGYLCQQAGLTTYLDTPEGPRCVGEAMQVDHWTLLVAAGMNDIDRRCDSYLAWLDNQRRTRPAVNLEFGHLRTLTTGVLGAADVASATIAIVGVALGFAQDTYNAYQSRLLLDIEGSTIETIVIERRIGFREELAGVPIYVKPDAVRVLQDYLRLCTPYAIRMSINTYSRARATGAPVVEDREAKALRQTLLSTKIVDVREPIRVPKTPKRQVTPPPKTGPAGPQAPVRLGQFEQTLSEADIRRYQVAACVPATGDLGPIGSPTRLAIKSVLGADDEILTDRKAILLERRLDDDGKLAEDAACVSEESTGEATTGPAPTRLNSFERSLSEDQIRRLQTAACVTPTGDLGPSGSPTRLAIRQVLADDDELVTDRDATLLERRLDVNGTLLEGMSCP